MGRRAWPGRRRCLSRIAMRGSHVVAGIARVVLRKGRWSPRVLALIVEWAALHQAELLANWERLGRRHPIAKPEISPSQLAAREESG